MKPHISPIARAVLDSDFANVRAITDDMPKDSPSAPAYQALRKAADAIENIIPADHALPAIRNALHRPPDDTELFFLLLHMGIALSHHRLEFAGDKERFSLLMKELLNNLRHPEFKACWLDERFGIQHSLHPGDHASRDIMNEALSLDISRDTGLWIRLKLNHAVASLHEMDLAAAENDLAEVESLIPRHPQFMNEFRRVRASWYQRTGNNDQALQILQDVPRNAPSAANMLHLRLGILCEAERWEEFDRELAVLQKSPVPFFKPAIDFYFRARKEYKQGHPEKARELAREAISLIKGQEIWNPNLLLVGCIELLAMAELSLRNSKTARLLLDMIDPNTSKIGYASLRMRLFLLEGNEPQAAVFLKRILAIGEHGPKFLARGLRNAPEVTAYQMENLRILASQMPSPSPAPADSASPPESAPFPTLLGENAAIRKAKTLIRKYAPLDTTVLITGETGTGKDVVARLIHESSPRARHPFIAVNCASISDSLMEAELFGYVKGAFTGATSNHDGLFTTAGQGTLFLDDVESMPAR
ncbi:MAG: sigma 54-interacting transcriptional regulator, partial [Planctomycetota bacterium]